MIQTAIGQILGAVAGAGIAGKKLYANERQAIKEETPQEKPETESVKKADEKPIQEQDLMQAAFNIAQKKGIASPRNILFNEEGRAIADYGEMSELLAKQALQQRLKRKRRIKDTFQSRLAEIKRRHEQLNKEEAQ